MAGVKRRVYEAAKDMGMSSEALVSVLKTMSVEVKSHMSSIDDNVVQQVRLKISREKEAVKEEEARRKEKAVQAAKAIADAQRRTVPAGSGPLKAGKGAEKKKGGGDEKVGGPSQPRPLAGMDGSKRRPPRRDHKEDHPGRR